MRAGVLLLLMGAMAACTRASAPAAAPSDTSAVPPSREAWGVRLNVHDGTRPRVLLDAPYMATYDADTLVHVLTASSLPGDPLGTRVEAELFDAAGQPSARLVADTLRYYERDRRFVASGGVVVTTEEGRRLDTEQLTWLEADARVTAPGFVHIVSPDEDVRGYGLTAHETLFPYRLTRVTAQVLVDG